MAKHTRTAAWDFVHRDIQDVTGGGAQREFTNRQDSLCAALDSLCGAALPVSVIYEIGKVVREAYEVGRESKK